MFNLRFEVNIGMYVSPCGKEKDDKCVREDATPLWDFLASAPSIKPILLSLPSLRFKFLGLLNTETNTLKGESLWKKKPTKKLFTNFYS